MNIAAQLLARAKQIPAAPAVTFEGRTLSFDQLAERACRIASGLVHDHGVRPGDRVALWLDNRLEFIEVMFACWIAGACIVPVNVKLHRREVDYIFGDSGSRALFTSDELIGTSPGNAFPRELAVLRMDSADYAALLASPRLPCAERSITDPAWIFYTSGTTGFPKGAILSHRNLIFMAMAYYSDIERVEVGATMLHAAPLSHGSGQYMLAHLLAGGAQVIFAKFDTAAVLQALASYPTVSMFAVPTMINRLVNAAIEDGVATPNLRTFIYGGAPMYVADLKRAITTFGPRFYQLYGQGETPMTISGLRRSEHDGPLDEAHLAKLGTCGVARSGVEFKVVDQEGVELAPGAPGEIVARSDCVMSGYWNNPAATAAALRDGWLWTGDIGSVDEFGYLSLHDRSKDMLISGGSNIYPREIEEVLLLHPAVGECSVIARANADLGEEPVAFIACRPGLSVRPTNLTRCAWRASRDTSDRAPIASWKASRRARTERYSRPSCARCFPRKNPERLDRPGSRISSMTLSSEKDSCERRLRDRHFVHRVRKAPRAFVSRPDSPCLSASPRGCAFRRSA